MPDFSALDLARIQFAFTISFHIIFPAITIGLASYLAVLEALWLRTQQKIYIDLYHFWVKIFAVNFGMGVVSGLVMSYQFGTNWSVLSDYAGSVLGPLLAYEVLTAVDSTKRNGSLLETGAWVNWCGANAAVFS